MSILQKLTEVEQAVVEYAEAAGKDIYEVFEEVVAHLEGKTEAAVNGEEESSESGDASTGAEVVGNAPATAANANTASAGSGTALPPGTHPPAAA